MIHSFTVILADVDVVTNEMVDALFSVECDDAFVSSRDGVVSIDFDREGPTLGHTIGLVVDVLGIVGFTVARIEVWRKAGGE